MQRTLLACVAAKHAFRKQASFRTYLFTVARHELYHHARAQRRDGARRDGAISSVGSVAAPLTTAGSRLARDAERRRVIAALRQLPLAAQTLLELYYWQELDIEALAQVLAAAPGAIKVRLHRARHRLRALLELPGDGPIAGLTRP